MTAEFGYQEELSFDDYEFGLIDNLKNAIAGGAAKTKQYLSKLSKEAKEKLSGAGKKILATLKQTKSILTRSKQRLLKLKAKVARIPRLRAKYSALVKSQTKLESAYRVHAAKAQKAQKAGFIIPLIPIAIGIAVAMGVEGIKVIMNLRKASAEQEARISALEEELAEIPEPAEEEEYYEEEYYEEEEEEEYD